MARRSAGLTFSLGVPLLSGFSAIPRKFRKISKVEYDGIRGSLSQRRHSPGPKDLEKITPDQGQYLPRPAVEPGRASRGNPTPTLRSCHLGTAAQLPAEGHGQHSANEGL